MQFNFSQLKYSIFIGLLCIIFAGCKSDKKDTVRKDDEISAGPKKTSNTPLIIKKPDSIKVPEGMVWVSGVKFTMGARDGDPYALPRERPAHPVEVDGFFIDVTEVTNAEFQKFVDATGYLTVAERPVDWDELKKQVPAGTPKPHDSLLQPGSLLFRKELKRVDDLSNIAQWWEWKTGANWKNPEGPGSSIENKMDYPVVHISYEDALAYAKWAGKDLPTEAEWEAAAHGKLPGGIYTWGDEEEKLPRVANTWQGEFPVQNIPEDGFKYASPVKSFPANSLGIYDMAGNVWELTKDNYNVGYYKTAYQQGVIRNPTGASVAYNPENPYQREKVIKGGSFLCNKSYCASYRISARMGMTLDSGSDHVGFRTVVRVNRD